MNNPVMLTENALRIVAKDIEQFYKKNAQNKDWCIDTCQNAADQLESFRKRVSELQAQLAKEKRRAAKAVREICFRCEDDYIEFEKPMRCDECEWRDDAEEGE